MKPQNQSNSIVDAQHVTMAEEVQRRLSIQSEMAAKLVAVIKAADDARFGNPDTDVVSLVDLALSMARALDKENSETEAIANSIACKLRAGCVTNGRPEAQAQRPQSIDVALPLLVDWSDSLAGAEALMNDLKSNLSRGQKFSSVGYLLDGAIALVDDVVGGVRGYDPHRQEALEAAG